MIDFQAQMDRTNRDNAFMIKSGIRLTEMETDRAVTEFTVTADSLNLFGGLHGGVYFTMADCAAGAAARSDGRRYATLNSSFDFLRGVSEGRLRAEATVRSRGRSVCRVSVRITDGGGCAVAEGMFAMFCTGDVA